MIYYSLGSLHVFSGFGCWFWGQIVGSHFRENWLKVCRILVDSSRFHLNSSWITLEHGLLAEWNKIESEPKKMQTHIALNIPYISVNHQNTVLLWWKYFPFLFFSTTGISLHFVIKKKLRNLSTLQYRKNLRIHKPALNVGCSWIPHLSDLKMKRKVLN